MKTEDILFGYFDLPACGMYEEDDGGFSVVVYQDGRLIHKTYIFCEIDQTAAEYKVSERSLLKIKALMEKYRTTIDSFDNRLHNDSVDGEENTFIFDGKQIITWNIAYTHPILLVLCREKRYFLALKQENKILSLFSAVKKILKSDGIDLELDKVEFTTNVGVPLQ